MFARWNQGKALRSQTASHAPFFMNCRTSGAQTPLLQLRKYNQYRCSVVCFRSSGRRMGARPHTTSTTVSLLAASLAERGLLPVSGAGDLPPCSCRGSDLQEETQARNSRPTRTQAHIYVRKLTVGVLAAGGYDIFQAEEKPTVSTAISP